MRCIIHIGTEKTGSTAIQEYLYSNRSGLRDNDGIHVCTSVGKGNNRALPAAFMSLDRSDDFIRSSKLGDEGQRKFWKQKLLEKFASEVHRAAKSAHTFLISSEHFHSRLLSVDEVRELHAYLAPLFDEFEIICYLRRQDQMALSRYSEALRAGFAPDSPLSPATAKLKKRKRLPPLFDFEGLLQRWAEPFGDACISPRIYSKTNLVGGDVIHDFLDALGLEARQPVQSVSSNPALSARAQLTLLSINSRLTGENRAAEGQLRTALVAYLEHNAPGKSCQPTASEAQAFYALFRPSNNVVARRFFSRDALFNEDFSDYPLEPQPPAPDAVLDLLLGFMLEQQS